MPTVTLTWPAAKPPSPSAVPGQVGYGADGLLESGNKVRLGLGLEG